ncbi:hypothetical protein NQZ68_026554 [Dissostichus eleginoides]|nr:hypothetical protein NQZ68_026554 [Dissostichus eleginoides]
MSTHQACCPSITHSALRVELRQRALQPAPGPLSAGYGHTKGFQSQGHTPWTPGTLMTMILDHPWITPPDTSRPDS